MTTQRDTLKREISLRSLFSLAFGTIIGVGWITVMGAWLSQAGPLGAIIGFIGGGLLMMAIGLCYAEVATMYPVSGGEVAYVYAAWGTHWSFAAGWFLAFTYIFVTSFEAISVGWIMSALIPGWGGPVIYTILGEDVQLWSLVLGVGIMMVITAINYRGGKTTAAFQVTMTYTLLLATLVFVVVGLAGGQPSNLEPLFVKDASQGVMVGVLAVFATTPFWFAGFDTIPQAMGEVREGAQLRLIPKVMLLAILLAMAFYCLVILTAAVSLPRNELLALELPVAGALEAAFSSVFLGKLVLFAGLCGLITTWNALFFASTRVVFALGRGHMIPHVFAKVHPQRGSPFMAVLFVGLIGTIGALFGRNAILPIVNASSSCLALVFLLVVLGVARLRHTRPSHKRPYRVPGGVFLPFLAGIFALGLLVISLYEPYRTTRTAGGGIPFEWMALGTWAVLGAVFWQVSVKMRREVTEEDRHWLILGEHEPQTAAKSRPPQKMR